MDVDASERRLDGGRRRSHEARRPRHPAMKKPTEERKVLHLSGIRSHGGAEARPAGRPWPRQHAWRDRVRQISKQDPTDSGKAD
jgi:hypothetical protein